MALTAGIKLAYQTLVNQPYLTAITKAGAEAANYPLRTIDPNVGMVEVPDERLQKIDGNDHS